MPGWLFEKIIVWERVFSSSCIPTLLYIFFIFTLYLLYFILLLVYIPILLQSKILYTIHCSFSVLILTSAGLEYIIFFDLRLTTNNTKKVYLIKQQNWKQWKPHFFAYTFIILYSQITSSIIKSNNETNQRISYKLTQNNQS